MVVSFIGINLNIAIADRVAHDKDDRRKLAMNGCREGRAGGMHESRGRGEQGRRVPSRRGPPVAPKSRSFSHTVLRVAASVRAVAIAPSGGVAATAPAGGVVLATGVVAVADLDVTRLIAMLSDCKPDTAQCALRTVLNA